MKKVFAIFVVLSSFLLIASNLTAQVESAKAATPKQVSGGVLNGKAISLPKPVYPPAAMEVKASGAVSVQVLIDEGGNVISANAISGNPLLRAAAVAAARSAKFSPTLLMGNPVKVSGVITYNFVSDNPLGIPPEDKDKVWLLGAFLSLVKSADSETIKAIGGEKEMKVMLLDLSTDLPKEIIAEKPLLDKLAAASAAERPAVASEVLNTFKKYLTPEQIWQADAGDCLGASFIEIIRIKLRSDAGKTSIDDSPLKGNLKKLSDLVLSAPTGVSTELVEMFKRISQYSETADLSSSDNLMRLFNAMEPLFKSFSDDDK